MSEGTVNPGKSKGILGFVLSLVAILLGSILMALLGGFNMFTGEFNAGSGAIPLILPIAAIYFSAMGMKASKAVGAKKGLATAGLIIGIVALLLNLWSFFGYMNYAEALNTLEGFGDVMDALDDARNN